jgi:hypothetical protein
MDFWLTHTTLVHTMCLPGVHELKRVSIILAKPFEVFKIFQSDWAAD